MYLYDHNDESFDEWAIDEDMNDELIYCSIPQLRNYLEYLDDCEEWKSTLTDILYA